ncbi:MAG: M23 family metallopeptidase [Acidimicrobiia bacterium]|nr:M23 family metallopeptidase [Acidimicrobiia bacterium]
MIPRALAASAAIAAALALPAAAGSAGAQAVPPPGAVPVVFYAPPVEGVVVDPFRPPAHPGAPGNRGLEYATRPGSAVRAAAAGIVTFAGRVGSGRHVTVAHADGVRTSYSFLAGMAVRTGQSVGAGDVLGTAGASFHFGARIGEAYVDPAVLLGIGGPARLVPLARRGATGWFGTGGPSWRGTTGGLRPPARR